MFKFIKKHALAISLTVGALIAACLGMVYVFPAQAGAVLTSAGNFFRAIGSKIGGWFSRGAATVATVEPIVDMPAAA